MTDPETNPERSPVSHRVRMENVPEAGRLIEIAANEEERAALAEAHGLLAVQRFDAELALDHWRRDGFRLRGTLRAEVTQQCVVTLAPVPAELEIPVDVLLVPEGSRLSGSRPSTQEELVLDFESDDPPETFSGSHADIGALCEQLFALALDPYPRAPGASFESDEPTDPPPPSPFAALKKLTEKK